MSTDHRDMRISDAEREQVVARLNTAVSEGRLTLAEFEERIDGVLRSRTYGEVEAFTGDLPETAASIRVPEVVEIRNRMSSLKREGRWTVPRRVAVTTRHGSVKLDFTRAIFNTHVVDIELDAKASSVTVVVPPGSTAEIDRIDASGSSVSSKISDTGAGVSFRISGEISNSSVTVRYQHRFLRWRW